MITDAALNLGIQTVAVAASEATDDYVDFDQVAPNKGTYTVNTELVFTITTTGTGASGTFDFALQDDPVNDFGTVVTLASTGAIAATACTAGREFRLKIPAEHQQFMRGYITVGGTGAGALTYEAHIVHLV